jgi:DNA anti-recombination protein RmuC
MDKEAKAFQEKIIKALVEYKSCINDKCRKENEAHQKVSHQEKEKIKKLNEKMLKHQISQDEWSKSVNKIQSKIIKLDTYKKAVECGLKNCDATIIGMIDVMIDALKKLHKSTQDDKFKQKLKHFQDIRTRVENMPATVEDIASLNKIP